MRMLTQGAIGAALLGLAACGASQSSATDEEANVETAAANRVEYLEDLAANTSNHVLADQLENEADAIETAAENRAEAIQNSLAAPADTDEDDND